LESGVGKSVLERHRGKAKLTVREAAPELTAADADDGRVDVHFVTR
jgi:hypothetical protein